MKKFALFFSSFAVVASAYAVSPKASKNLSQTQREVAPLTQVTAVECMNGKVLEKNLKPVTKLVTRAEDETGEESQFSVSYNEPAGLFALGLSEERSGLKEYSLRKGPAYVPLTWKNTSKGATKFEWTWVNPDTKEEESANTANLVRTETCDIVDPPILYGSNDAGQTDLFQFGATKTEDGTLGDPNVSYFWGGDCNWRYYDRETDSYEDVKLGMSTYMHGNNGGGFTGVSFMQYCTAESDAVNPETGLDPVFTNPDPSGYGFENPVFAGYGNVFNKPIAPYFISKLWGWMNLIVNKATTVTMTLYKINDEGQVTDEILGKGSADIDPKNPSEMIVFDLFAVDEDGLETEDPIIIDCAFFAEMTFINEDVVQVYPIAGRGATYPLEYKRSPYSNHAYILINEADVQYFIKSPYIIETKTDKIAFTDWLWMVDAVYPWTIEVNGNTKVQAPEEGGNVSFTLESWEDINYYNITLSEGCDWIDLEKATIENEEGTYNQILTVPVTALPEGVTGRTATINLDYVATSLILTVIQGDGSGVNNVVVSEKNAEYFDLAGRRVMNPDKGIYIKKVGNKAEKVIR